MYVECRLIENDELFDRQRTGTRRGDKNVFIEPGMIWFLPDIWDHQDPDLEQYLPRLRHQSADLRKTSLSYHYLHDWATRRDPLAIMMPHHDVFYPDAAPNGFKGYRVTGSLPRLSINRFIEVGNRFQYMIKDGNITVRGYHG